MLSLPSLARDILTNHSVFGKQNDSTLWYLPQQSLATEILSGMVLREKEDCYPAAF
jgi:hypothetical protein